MNLMFLERNHSEISFSKDILNYASNVTLSIN